MNTLTEFPRTWPAHAARLAQSTVAVLLGGRSSEREVSLATGAAVLRALATRRESTKLPLPQRTLALEIEPDGRWKLEGQRLPAPEALARLPRETLFFLALHGGEGEDGSLQGMLSVLGHAHTGSGVAASALCMDKAHTKAVLAEAGLRVARGRLVRPGEWRVRAEAIARELVRLGPRGLVVKPNRGGSSVATSVLDPGADPRAAVERALATGDLALVEERVHGSEATCAVLGNARGEPFALTPVEIVPKAGRFFDYEEKYSPAGAAEHCPPIDLPPATSERLRVLACAAHRAAGCDGYSRTDFLVPRDAAGAAEEPLVLEINTLPGMTARSLLPLAAATHGLSFEELCLEILALALARNAP